MGFLRLEFCVAAAAALFIALALMPLSPERRAYGRGNLGWLGLTIAVEGLYLLLTHLGLDQAAGIAGTVSAIGMGIVLIRLVGYGLFRIVLPGAGANSPRIVGDLVVTIAILAWGFLWLRRSGLDFGSLVATSALVTGIVVFSMQETLGNIMGGLALQADDSVRVGDWIKLDDVRGRVVEVRWRFTAIETNDRETVIVPNSYLVKNRFSIAGRRSDADVRWRRWVWFNVTLESTPARVCEVLERAMHNADIPNVARELHANAVLMDLVPGAGRYALRFWIIEPALEDPASSRVREHCLAALERHGMKLALTVEEHRVVKQTAARRLADEASEIERRVGVLRTVDLFAHLEEGELQQLAQHMVSAPFPSGAVMTHQGDVAHWLYLIVSGDAEVWIDAPGHGNRCVATLKACDVFGEMSLLTGAPRSASVIAKTDVSCYRLSREGIGELLRARPDFAAELTQIMTSRGEELEKQKTALRGSVLPAHDTLLKRIKGYFGLE